MLLSIEPKKIDVGNETMPVDLTAFSEKYPSRALQLN